GGLAACPVEAPAGGAKRGVEPRSLSRSVKLALRMSSAFSCYALSWRNIATLAHTTQDVVRSPLTFCRCRTEPLVVTFSRTISPNRTASTTNPCVRGNHGEQNETYANQTSHRVYL